MPVSVPEFITYAAYALRNNLGFDIAIAARGSGEILAIARDTRGGVALDIATPIVNLLQNNDGLTGAYYICTTLAPTEACLGISKIRRVAFIYEFVAAGFRRRDLGGAPPWINLQAVPFNLPAVQVNAIAGFAGMTAAARSTAAAALFAALVQMPQPARLIRGNVYGTRVNGRLAAPAALPVPAAVNTAGAFSPLRDRLFMYLAHSVVAARAMLGGAQGGHSIGSVLVDGNGAISGYSINNVDTNSTFHAETQIVMQTNAANGYAGLPAHGRLYTTLQCCHMCAGFVVTAAPNFNVRYAQVDPIMNNSALARGVNGCSEALQDTANVGHQVMAAMGPGRHQVTQVLNSQVGTLFHMEAVHAYRSLQHYATAAADAALWAQGRAIINSLKPGLV